MKYSLQRTMRRTVELTNLVITSLTECPQGMTRKAMARRGGLKSERFLSTRINDMLAAGTIKARTRDDDEAVIYYLPSIHSAPAPSRTAPEFRPLRLPHGYWSPSRVGAEDFKRVRSAG